MASVSDKTLASALAYDPLATAEEMTGKRYDTDGTTESLGLYLHLGHVQRKRMLLEDADDTPLTCDLPVYLRIAADEGFEIALELPFRSDSSEQDETLYILFHREHGILLVFDTWQGKVNGGNFYYNWTCPDAPKYSSVTSSGGWKQYGEQWIWAGGHDCREALRFHIRRLREEGSFVTPWLERPHLWPLHHGDTRGVEREPVGPRDRMKIFDAIREARIAMLPEHVRKAITPEVR